MVLGRGRGADGDRAPAEAACRPWAISAERATGSGGLADGVSQAREIGSGDRGHHRLEAGPADVLAVLVGRDAEALGNGQPEPQEGARGSRLSRRPEPSLPGGIALRSTIVVVAPSLSQRSVLCDGTVRRVPLPSLSIRGQKSKG